MRIARYLVCCALFAFTSTAAVASPSLSDDDLENCDVLMGRAKKAPFKDLLGSLRQAASSGKADDALRYAAVLNNKMACIDEEMTGDAGWGVLVEVEGGGVAEARHPQRGDPSTNPELAATLREAIRALERAAETDLRARMLLGQYYAGYHGFLRQPDKGYVYQASVYSAECRGVRGRKSGAAARSRCEALRHDRILYNSLLSPERRGKLDADAAAWADRYLAQRAR